MYYNFVFESKYRNLLLDPDRIKTKKLNKMKNLLIIHVVLCVLNLSWFFSSKAKEIKIVIKAFVYCIFPIVNVALFLRRFLAIFANTITADLKTHYMSYKDLWKMNSSKEEKSIALSKFEFIFIMVPLYYIVIGTIGKLIGNRLED